MRRAAACTLLVGAAAGAFAQAPETYSKNEAARLGFCAGLTINAKYIMEQRRASRPAEEVKQAMQKNSAANLLVPLVDKVYAEPAKKPWDFAGDFFDECAENMASVPKARVGMAQFCMYNSLIAVVARQSRDAGGPKQRAQLLVPFKGKTPDSIIDAVYAREKGSGPTQMEAWNECVAVLTKD